MKPMDSGGKLFNGYGIGNDFWHDNAVRYGNDEAFIICKRYLNMQLKAMLPDLEKAFCWELFTAMLEASANKADTANSVYPYDSREANKHGETALYYESFRCNTECARGIDEIIRKSRYSENCYNLEVAAMIAILKYGFTRVNMVLAFNIQRRLNDGRYSRINKKWGQTFTVPERAFDGSCLNSHACLVDGFTDYVRKFQE